jgi:clan AA aspartic protease (TIGR02281 family)
MRSVQFLYVEIKLVLLIDLGKPAMFILRTILLCLCAVSTVYADCEPEKNTNPEFAKSLKRAIKGDVIEQRNVAVSYEAGYLVGPCFANAYFWYKQAAKGGDQIAAEWVSRNDTLIALMNGPACSGEECKVSGVNYGTTGTVYAGDDGHFFTQLTVNGKTTRALIDTGASLVALNEAGATELGIDFSQGEQSTAGTANGAVVNRIVTVPTLSVAGVSMDNVQVACCINSSVSLIGMSFLSRVQFSVAGNTLSIQK